MVYTLVGDLRRPYFEDFTKAERMKRFTGPNPKYVAQKVVTDICRSLKNTDKEGFERWCRPVTEKQIAQREKELRDNRELITENPGRAWSQVLNKTLYPGFQFVMEDLNNIDIKGNPKSFQYYGERIKRDNPKMLRGVKLQFESNVIPIRKNFNLVQSLLDHLIASDRASKKYQKIKDVFGNRANTAEKLKGKNVIEMVAKMSPSEIRARCDQTARKTNQDWTVKEVEHIMREMGLPIPSKATKKDKCELIIKERAKSMKGAGRRKY